ncbi:MAG TPA: hypothetical protein VJU60_09090 [Thermoleophilaceae bacterium]|nr:hypothetical protein [Thermoleophilaceae bacterium]
MNIKRALLALGIAALMAFALSGCFVITADSPSQQNIIGDVVVHTEACVSDSTSGSPCGNLGNSGFAFGGEDGQFLLAYRVPNGYGAPAQVTSTSGTPALTMDASPSYVQQLTSLAPPPAGDRWVGYISQAVTAPAADGQYVFDTHFTRPPAENGVPSSLPFQYLTVVGGRDVDSTLLATRDVACGPDFTSLITRFEEETSPDGGTACVDSPSLASSATQLPADTELPTRDLGISPGAAVANRGSTVNVPFSLNFVGPADPSAVFTLASGVNGLAGATAVPAAPTFVPPAQSNTPTSALVKVPANAAPGTYAVPFSATLSNGETRSAVGTLTVLKDTTGPNVTISLAKVRLAKGAKKGFRVTVGCSEDCSVLASLTATPKALKAAKVVKLGSAKATVAAGGKKTLLVKLNRTGKRKLAALVRHHKRLRGKLTVVATDTVGNPTTASKTVVLK